MKVRTGIVGILGLCSIASSSVSSEYTRYMRALEIIQEYDPKPLVSSVASGFGASDEDLFLAVSYSDRDLQTDVSGDDDGSIVLGVGLGDPKENLGYEIVLGITSVSTPWWGDGKFADEGNFNIKVHREITPLLEGEVASVAVGASNIMGWGGTTQIPTNYYVAYSEKFLFGDFNQYGAAISFGYGSSISDGETSGDFFGGIGVSRSSYNTSLSYIGNEAHISATWFVPNLPGLALTFTRADAWNQENIQRNIFSVGYAFKFGGYQS